MKKILTMAAVALLAASCSNDKDVITPDLGTANAPVAIKLTQSEYKGIENSCQRSRRCIYSWERDGYYLDSHLVL